MMSGKLRLLPSELGRLVLGYLKQHDCNDAAEIFLKELPELGECLAVQKLGRPVCTTVGDRSLEDMLNDYADTREQVQNSIQQHPGVLRNISKSWDLNQQLMQITKIATEKSQTPELGMLGRKSATSQIVRTRLLNKQLKNSLVSTQPCCDHCSLRRQATPNPLLDVSTTSIKDLPGSSNYSSTNLVEDNHRISRREDITGSDYQDLPFSQKDIGLLKRMQSGFPPEFDQSQLNIESSSSSQELCSSNISSSSIDGTPQKRKGNQVKRRSHGQTGSSNIPATVEEDVHFEIMLKKLMEDTNLHEKIAENINRGLSTSQSRCLEEDGRQDENSSSEAVRNDDSKLPKPGNNSSQSFELDSIITNIVSETTESPTFESILEEVFGSSLQKCTNMNNEEIQNELSKIVARPLSTPVPQSHSGENSTNQRISITYKENQDEKIDDAKIKKSSQLKNDKYTNEMLPETIDVQNDNLDRLALNNSKRMDTEDIPNANTEDIPNTNTSSKNENFLSQRSEMNVPHKLRHKMNRKSSSTQVNSSSCETPQKDNLLKTNSQHEGKEASNENLNSNVFEKKSENNIENNMEHTNNPEDIVHVGMQSKELEISEKSLQNQNCVNQLSPKRPLADIENAYQIEDVDNECTGSREQLDESYRISDISHLPNTLNKNKPRNESEVTEPDKTTSKSDVSNQEINSENQIMTPGPSADIISRNTTTPIKSLTIPGIAESLPVVKQVESPYKIVERNDSTLTELKSMRSDLSSPNINSQWSPRLNTSLSIEDNNNIKLSNLGIANISTAASSSNILKVNKMNVNIQSSTSISVMENNFSRNHGNKIVAPVQLIPLPMNVGKNISSERYRRLAPRTIAPRPIAPKSDSNMSRRQNTFKNETKKSEGTEDAPIIELSPIDTVIYPVQKNIIPVVAPAPVTTYTLPNNIVFTIPNVTSVNPGPDLSTNIANTDDNKKVSPSKKKCPKSPIRGRSVNMTRVKPKTGVGKAGKRKLRNMNNLENIAKTNELVSAAVNLLLSPSHKSNTPFKQIGSPSPGKFNEDLISIIQHKANELLNEKENERNTIEENSQQGSVENEDDSIENNTQMGSVSPKLKELIQISKDIGSERKRTRCSSLHKSPISKGLPSRGSQSTPSHKNSHIRALDFGTPGKEISPRKLRRQQVMQSLNFSPSLSFKKTMKSSSLDDKLNLLCNKFSPKKRILERIQEETNNSLSKEDITRDEILKEYPVPSKKPRKRKSKPTVKPKSNIDNKDCSEILKYPLSDNINNSGNGNIEYEPTNKDLILETPIKTPDILTLELATPFLKSFKKNCDDNDDLNTPFPKVSVDHDQTKSPKTDNDLTISSIPSTHYQPGVKEHDHLIKDKDSPESHKTVSHPNDIENNKNNYEELKKEQKRNKSSKNKINQKKKTEINMGKKIEEEIASRFGSPSSNTSQTDNLMSKVNHSKEVCLQNQDLNSNVENEMEKNSGKNDKSNYLRIDENMTKSDKRKFTENGKFTPQKRENSPKRVTRSAKKLEDSFNMNEENITKSSSSQKICNDKENKNAEKTLQKLTKEPCKNANLLSAEGSASNMACENLAMRGKIPDFQESKERHVESNISDDSSGESSRWHIDDELPDIQSSQTDVNNEDQRCSESLQCENKMSDISEIYEYDVEDFDDMTLGYSEFIDLFSLNLTPKELPQKKLNKRLWVEGSSGWSPKRKRSRNIINQGRQMTPSHVESPINKLPIPQEILTEDERTTEIIDVPEQHITPARQRGSVSERSVGSSVSSNSPGRLLIVQSPYWMLDENITTTPNQSISCENKDDIATPKHLISCENKEGSSQSNKSSPIEGIENLSALHHQVPTCLKCNKELQNGNISVEKEDQNKDICVCMQSAENLITSVEDENYSSETIKQYQKRCEKSAHINAVLVNGGTLEIAQSPTKQMAIVTQPQIAEKPQKKLKVMKKMNIEEFLKNVHKEDCDK